MKLEIKVLKHSVCSFYQRRYPTPYLHLCVSFWLIAARSLCTGSITVGPWGTAAR